MDARTLPSLALTLVSGALSLLAQSTGSESAFSETDRPEIVLEEFSITGHREDAYYAGTAVSATKTATRLIDTPASITVLNERIFSEQLLIDADDALANFASLTRTGDAFGAFTNYASRGFWVTNTNNYLRNGRPAGRFIAPPIESVDRIEFLKGPSGVLYGRGSPGGVINVVTKRPTEVFSGLVRVTTGDNAFFKADVDVGGPVLADDTLAYRLNLSRQDSESYRDSAFVDRTFAALTLEWRPIARTTVLAYFDYLDDDRPETTGTVALNGRIIELPKSRVLNQPWSRYRSENWNAGFNSRTILTPDWTLYAGYNLQHFERHRTDSLPSSVFNATTGDITFRAQDRRASSDYHYINVDLTGRLAHGSIEHTLLLGLNQAREPGDGRDSAVIAGPAMRQNVFNPTYTDAPPAFSFPNPAWTSRDSTTGLYIQDQMTLTEQLDVVAGLRHDTYRTRYDQGDYHYRAETDNVTPRFGVVYRLRPDMSLYASYTEGFEDNGVVEDSALDNFGEQLDPTVGRQYEVGAKLELFKRRFGVTAALFQIERTGEPYEDTVLNRIVQRGEVRHRGLELDFSGRLSAAWQVFASLMLLDTEVLDAEDPALVGRETPGAPSFSASAWASYEFHQDFLSGLTLNFGLQHQGDRAADAANSFELPAYTAFDLGVAYRVPFGDDTLTVRLNLNNAFDKVYYYAGGFGVSSANVGIGERRTWRLAAEYRF